MIGVSACDIGGSKINEPFKDAHVDARDEGGATIVTMPDGFGNFAYKCIPGSHTLVVTLYHGDNAYGGGGAVVDPKKCP